ncbi:ATP-dependent helicase [Candidatus Desantisbacteria bacterium]|nr:ATP-dependent helicase [Candidatus Desantisbacteria bacterium]
MIFEKNHENEKYISSRGKIILDACPGSGKTSTIAYKLNELVKECEQKYGNFSGIACLSFTNVAKDEITQKYKEFVGTSVSYPHSISTIDNFINKYITLPFYYLINNSCIRPKIIDDEEFIDKAWMDRWNKKYKTNSGQLICFSYPASSINFEFKDGYSSSGHKPDFSKVDKNIFNEYCKNLKNWQINKGLLKSSDSTFIAFQILNNYPRIASWLTKKFPVIIIDEAQDTSEIQHAIFDKLIEHGLENLELVGDPYQCLYEWRDAKPNLFYKKNIDTCLPLNTCRRSTQKIVDCYSLLRSDNIPKIKSINNEKDIPIQIYTYSINNEKEIIDKYINNCKMFSNNHIVVRGKKLKNKLIGNIDEDIEPWKHYAPYEILIAKNELNGKKIKESVQRIHSLLALVQNPKAEYHDIKEYEKQLKQDNMRNALIIEFLKNIPSYDLQLSDWTIKTEKYFIDTFKLKVKIEFDLKQGKWKKKHDSKIKDMFTVNSILPIPISTIHQVKGMTFDSLLLMLSEDSKGQNISIKDIYKPTDFPNEKQRLIYVSMSRPKYLLAIGIPDTIKKDLIYSTFGKEIEII